MFSTIPRMMLVNSGAKHSNIEIHTAARNKAAYLLLDSIAVRLRRAPVSSSRALFENRWRPPKTADEMIGGFDHAYTFSFLAQVPASDGFIV
jgi:hypothetical protein